jgi:hypothetical protein
MRHLLLAACAALACCVANRGMAADARRDEIFLALVKERHIPPLSQEIWGRHIGDDCVWVGGALRVVGRAEVQSLQMDTGKRVEIQDFVAHDYGDTVVLTYLVIEHYPQAGRDVTTRLRKLDTYLSRAGRWQLIANAEVVGKPDRQAVKLDAQVLDRYVGDYVTEFGDKPVHTRIWREGTRLFAQTEGQEKGELMPLNATEFFDASEPQEDGPLNVFEIGAAGTPIYWIYRNAGVDFRSRRIESASR